MLTTHVLGAHALSRAVAPGMIKAQAGSILFIASMTALLGMPKVVAYSTAKSRLCGHGQGDGQRIVAARRPRQRHRSRLDRDRHDAKGHARRSAKKSKSSQPHANGPFLANRRTSAWRPSISARRPRNS